jgi:hypothetical protein
MCLPGALLNASAIWAEDLAFCPITDRLTEGPGAAFAGGELARSTFRLHRQQLEDFHRALPVTAGQERETVGERLCCSEIVGLDDRVADQIACRPFTTVIAN